MLADWEAKRNPLKYTKGGNIKKSWRKRNKMKDLTVYNMPTSPFAGIEMVRTLACMAEASPAPKLSKKENNMSKQDVNLSIDVKEDSNRTERDQRSYLRHRLHEAFYGRDNEAQKHFGLQAPEYPHTMRDFINRIKEDKFTVDSENMDDSYAFHYFSWFEPGHKKDLEGYEKARKALEQAFQDAKDAVNILPVVEGLKALQTFENRTYR